MSASLNAQNAIKFNPLGALFGNLGFGFEHALNDNSSVQLNAGVLSKTYDFGGFFGSSGYKIKYSGFQVSPEYRMYFDQSIRGWYAGAFVNYNSVTVKTEYTDNSTIEDTKSTISNVGGGIEFGRQWLLGGNENFVIDLNLGAGYQSASVDGGDDSDIEFSLAASGVWPKLSFAVGYAF